MNKINNDSCCPIGRSELLSQSDRFFKFKKFKYPVISGIPCLYFDKKDDNVLTKKTFNKKNFNVSYFK